MLSLIGYFRHKRALFLRPFSDRKRITKASYCRDDTYWLAKGEGDQSAGKNYAIQARISHFCVERRAIAWSDGRLARLAETGHPALYGDKNFVGVADVPSPAP